MVGGVEIKTPSLARRSKLDLDTSLCCGISKDLFEARSQVMARCFALEIYLNLHGERDAEHPLHIFQKLIRRLRPFVRLLAS